MTQRPALSESRRDGLKYSDVYHRARSSGYFYDKFVQLRICAAVRCPVSWCHGQYMQLSALRSHCLECHWREARFATGFKCFVCGLRRGVCGAMVTHICREHRLTVSTDLVEELLLYTDFDMIMNSERKNETVRGFWSDVHLVPLPPVDYRMLDSRDAAVNKTCASGRMELGTSVNLNTTADIQRSAVQSVPG